MEYDAKILRGTLMKPTEIELKEEDLNKIESGDTLKFDKWNGLVVLNLSEFKFVKRND